MSSGLITINSTAGLEAIIFGKPVLALGRGYYSKREVVFKPESKIAIKNDLLKMLENPNSEKSSLEMNKVLTKMMKQTYPGPNIFPPKDTIGGNTKKFMAEGLNVYFVELLNNIFAKLKCPKPPTEYRPIVFAL